MPSRLTRCSLIPIGSRRPPGGLLGLLLAVCLLASPAAAQQTVCEGQEGASAISCIQSNYSPSGTLGYDTARDTLFANIDSEDSGELEGIYSGFTITLTSGEDPTQDAFDKSMNTEHVYPQSKGAGSEPRKSDMHNLHPARSQVNSARGNIAFGESADEQTDTWYFESTTQSTSPGSNIDTWSERLGSSAWEPRESREGDVARATFYFYAMYKSSADDAFFDAMEDQLLAWHEADPPSDAELARSEAIAQRQGNENPFVLDTTLAERTFSGGGGEDPPPEDGPTADVLFISELSDAEDLTNEFLEVYNDSSEAVDLAAIDGKIVQDQRDGNQVFTFDFGDDETSACESTVVPAKGVLVVGRGASRTDFETEWGSLSERSNYCAFNQNSFFPGTDERAWDLRAGGTQNEPTDGTLLDQSPQFDNMEANRAYQDLGAQSPWIGGEQLATATPGMLDDGQALPVELTGFEAAATEQDARLTWQTASETSNAGFEVQRQREEGDGWTRVGYVQSKAEGGTTTGTQSYQYTAKDLSVGTHRFRLKQVDLDGRSVRIDPVSVEIQMQGAVTLNAPAPNPVSTSTTLSFAVKKEAETTITLYNTLGQRVAAVYEGTPPAEQQQRVRLDAGALPSGTYFLRIQANGQTQARRLTVVR